MRYLKTINLYDSGIYSALVNGQLTLQCGQWFKCGDNDNSISRFISCNNGVINAVHYNKNTKNNVKFNLRAKLHKLQNSNLSASEHRQQLQQLGL